MKSAREHNEILANELCDQAGCNEKIARIHFDQIVNRAWNPHPSQSFVSWWFTQREFKETGISAVRARNTRRIWDQYKEARGFGVTND